MQSTPNELTQQGVRELSFLAAQRLWSGTHEPRGLFFGVKLVSTEILIRRKRLAGPHKGRRLCDGDAETRQLAPFHCARIFRET